MILDWLRFDRRLIHLVKLWDIKNIIHIYGWWSLICWPVELLMGFGHLFGMSHLMQFYFGFHARSLTQDEVDFAKSIYGNRINYSILKINTRSKFSKHFHTVFVTGHVINYHSIHISQALMVHELMHVYQYEQVGIVYIPRCLFAQASIQGYDFGKLEDHQDILIGSRAIKKLNYEQQAEFVETMYRSRNEISVVNNLRASLDQMNFQV